MLMFFKPTFDSIKKIFIVTIVFLAVINLFFYSIDKNKRQLKLDPPAKLIEKNRQDIYKVINDKELLSTKEGKYTVLAYRTMFCTMLGEACTDNPKDGDKNYDTSVFGRLTKLFVLPFSRPPASGIYWAYSGLETAGFVPKTLAAEGIGFSVIKPFANIWKIFRDFSYMLLVLILIAIGFMVMFRTKIDAQTVITVESALPRIVMSLILITFSFAIAGFMIDLMYISIILIIAVLGNNGNNFDIASTQNTYLGAGMGQLFKDVTAGRPWSTSGMSTLLHGPGMIQRLTDSLFGIFPGYVNFILRSLVGVIFTIWSINRVYSSTIKDATKVADDIEVASFSLGKVFGFILGGASNAIFTIVMLLIGSSVIVNVLFLILFVGTFLFLIFRVFALLFFSYIKLLLLVILGPFLLIFESIPGKNVFSWWLKSLIGLLIAFPIVITVVLIGYIIVNSSTPTTYSDLTLPYLNGIDTDSFKILIGIGLILIIPDLVKLTRETLGIKDLPINLGLGTFFGGAGAAMGGLTGLAGQVGSFSMGLSAITGKSINEIFKKGGSSKKGDPGEPADLKAAVSQLSQAVNNLKGKI